MPEIKRSFSKKSFVFKRYNKQWEHDEMDSGRSSSQEKRLCSGSMLWWTKLFFLFWYILSVQDTCLQVYPRPSYLSQSDSGHLLSSFLHLRKLRKLQNCSAYGEKALRMVTTWDELIELLILKGGRDTLMWSWRQFRKETLGIEVVPSEKFSSLGHLQMMWSSYPSCLGNL